MKFSRGVYDQIRDRFFEFGDAVVRDVSMGMTGGYRVTVVLDAKDAESPSGWSKVTFQLTNAKEFRFEHGRRTFVVIGSGIQVFDRDGRVYLFLDGYPDDGDVMPKRETNMAYVAAEDCEMIIEPVPPDAFERA